MNSSIAPITDITDAFKILNLTPEGTDKVSLEQKWKQIKDTLGKKVDKILDKGKNNRSATEIKELIAFQHQLSAYIFICHNHIFTNHIRASNIEINNALELLGFKKEDWSTMTESKLNAQYRKLSIKHHPDRSGGDEHTFKNLSEAKFLLLGELNNDRTDKLVENSYSENENHLNDDGTDQNQQLIVQNSNLATTIHDAICQAEADNELARCQKYLEKKQRLIWFIDNYPRLAQFFSPLGCEKVKIVRTFINEQKSKKPEAICNAYDTLLDAITAAVKKYKGKKIEEQADFIARKKTHTGIPGLWRINKSPSSAQYSEYTYFDKKRFFQIKQETIEKKIKYDGDFGKIVYKR